MNESKFDLLEINRKHNAIRFETTNIEIIGMIRSCPELLYFGGDAVNPELSAMPSKPCLPVKVMTANFYQDRRCLSASVEMEIIRSRATD
jgi:hypothetical protein